MEAFLHNHASQIQILPAPLRAKLYDRISLSDFDYSRQLLNDAALVDIHPDKDIFVWPMWSFTHADQVKTVLSESPDLTATVRHHINTTIAKYQADGILSSKNIAPLSESSTVDDIMNVLFLVSFQYQIQTSAGSETYYYMLLDNAGSPTYWHFDTANEDQLKNPSMNCFVFIHIPSQNAPMTPYLIAYPRRVIAKGERISRSELTHMPNYKNTMYWPFHYRTSTNAKKSTYEWFIGYETLKPILTDLIESRFAHPKCISMVNVGCGNSSISESMLKDGLIGFSWNLDISQDILRHHDTTLKQDNITMDIGQKPFRENNMIDLILDKGTLDGILYQSVDTVKTVLKNLRGMVKKDGCFVWVSLGQPENRIPLVEMDGEWNVEKILEISAQHTEETHGSIQKCYLYLCLPN